MTELHIYGLEIGVWDTMKSLGMQPIKQLQVSRLPLPIATLLAGL